MYQSRTIKVTGPQQLQIVFNSMFIIWCYYWYY